MKDTYTINDLWEITIDLENHRENILFGIADSGMAPVAEQHFLLALSHLEMASRMMKLAHYAQMKKE